MQKFQPIRFGDLVRVECVAKKGQTSGRKFPHMFLSSDTVFLERSCVKVVNDLDDLHFIEKNLYRINCVGVKGDEHGDVVQYGAPFVLETIRSDYRGYLKLCEGELSYVEKDSFKLGILSTHAAVHPELDRSTHFKFQSVLPYRTHGDVYYDEQFHICCVTNDTLFLHVGEPSAYYGTIGHSYTQRGVSCNIEVNMALKSEADGAGIFKWKCHYYHHYDDNVRLRLGQCIRFYHPSSKSYLVCSNTTGVKSGLNVGKAAYFKSFEEKSAFISPKSLYRIEDASNGQQGGSVQWNRQYRLRHVLSGGYLYCAVNPAYDEDTPVISIASFNCDPSVCSSADESRASFLENTLFRFLPTVNTHDNEDIHVDIANVQIEFTKRYDLNGMETFRTYVLSCGEALEQSCRFYPDLATDVARALSATVGYEGGDLSYENIRHSAVGSLARTCVTVLSIVLPSSGDEHVALSIMEAKDHFDDFEYAMHEFARNSNSGLSCPIRYDTLFQMKVFMEIHVYFLGGVFNDLVTEQNQDEKEKPNKPAATTLLTTVQKQIQCNRNQLSFKNIGGLERFMRLLRLPRIFGVSWATVCACADLLQIYQSVFRVLSLAANNNVVIQHSIASSRYKDRDLCQWFEVDFNSLKSCGCNSYMREIIAMIPLDIGAAELLTILLTQSRSLFTGLLTESFIDFLLRGLKTSCKSTQARSHRSDRCIVDLLTSFTNSNSVYCSYNQEMLYNLSRTNYPLAFLIESMFVSTPGSESGAKNDAFEATEESINLYVTWGGLQFTNFANAKESLAMVAALMFDEDIHLVQNKLTTRFPAKQVFGQSFLKIMQQQCNNCNQLQWIDLTKLLDIARGRNLATLNYSFAVPSDMLGHRQSVIQILRHYLTSLDFLSSLCENRSYNCIDKIQKCYSYSMLLFAMQNTDYPLVLRFRFAKLMRVLYIDRFPLEDLKFPNSYLLFNDFNVRRSFDEAMQLIKTNAESSPRTMTQSASSIRLNEVVSNNLDEESKYACDGEYEGCTAPSVPEPQDQLLSNSISKDFNYQALQDCIVTYLFSSVQSNHGANENLSNAEVMNVTRVQYSHALVRIMHLLLKSGSYSTQRQLEEVLHVSIVVLENQVRLDQRETKEEWSDYSTLIKSRANASTGHRRGSVDNHQHGVEMTNQLGRARLQYLCDAHEKSLTTKFSCDPAANALTVCVVIMETQVWDPRLYKWGNDNEDYEIYSTDDVYLHNLFDGNRRIQDNKSLVAGLPDMSWEWIDEWHIGSGGWKHGPALAAYSGKNNSKALTRSRSWNRTRRQLSAAGVARILESRNHNVRSVVAAFKESSSPSGRIDFAAVIAFLDNDAQSNHHKHDLSNNIDFENALAAEDVAQGKFQDLLADYLEQCLNVMITVYDIALQIRSSRLLHAIVHARIVNKVELVTRDEDYESGHYSLTTAGNNMLDQLLHEDDLSSLDIVKMTKGKILSSIFALLLRDDHSQCRMAINLLRIQFTQAKRFATHVSSLVILSCCREFCAIKSAHAVLSNYVTLISKYCAYKKEIIKECGQLIRTLLAYIDEFSDLTPRKKSEITKLYQLIGVHHSVMQLVFYCYKQVQCAVQPQKSSYVVLCNLATKFITVYLQYDCRNLDFGQYVDRLVHSYDKGLGSVVILEAYLRQNGWAIHNVPLTKAIDSTLCLVSNCAMLENNAHTPLYFSLLRSYIWILAVRWTQVCVYQNINNRPMNSTGQLFMLQLIFDTKNHHIRDNVPGGSHFSVETIVKHLINAHNQDAEPEVIASAKLHLEYFTSWMDIIACCCVGGHADYVRINRNKIKCRATVSLGDILLLLSQSSVILSDKLVQTLVFYMYSVYIEGLEAFVLDSISELLSHQCFWPVMLKLLDIAQAFALDATLTGVHDLVVFAIVPFCCSIFCYSDSHKFADTLAMFPEYYCSRGRFEDILHLLLVREVSIDEISLAAIKMNITFTKPVGCGASDSSSVAASEDTHLSATALTDKKAFAGEKFDDDTIDSCLPVYKDFQNNMKASDLITRETEIEFGNLLAFMMAETGLKTSDAAQANDKQHSSSPDLSHHVTKVDCKILTRLVRFAREEVSANLSSWPAGELRKTVIKPGDDFPEIQDVRFVIAVLRRIVLHCKENVPEELEGLIGALIRVGAMSLVAETIANCSYKSLVFCSLKLCNHLLLDGGTAAQEALFTCLSEPATNSSTSDQDHGERKLNDLGMHFFESLNDRINLAIYLKRLSRPFQDAMAELYSTKYNTLSTPQFELELAKVNARFHSINTHYKNLQHHTQNSEILKLASCIENVLLVVELLCARGYRKFQKVIENQGTDNSYTIMSGIVSFLQCFLPSGDHVGMLRIIDVDLIGLGFSAINQYMSGQSFANQEFIACKTNILDMLHHLFEFQIPSTSTPLKDDESNFCGRYRKQVNLKYSAFIMIQRMTEGRAASIRCPVHQQLLQMNLQCFSRRLKLIKEVAGKHIPVLAKYNNWDKDKSRSEELWVLQEGFYILALFRRLASIKPSLHEVIAPLTATGLRALRNVVSTAPDKKLRHEARWKYYHEYRYSNIYAGFDTSLISIEVMWTGYGLRRVSFRIPDECLLLSEDIIAHFKATIDFTDEDRMYQLLRRTDEVDIQLKHYLMVSRDKRLLHITHFQNEVDMWTLAVSVLINICIVLSLHQDDDTPAHYEPAVFGSIVQALTIVQCALVVFRQLQTMILRLPIIRKSYIQKMNGGSLLDDDTGTAVVSPIKRIKVLMSHFCSSAVLVIVLAFFNGFVHLEFGYVPTVIWAGSVAVAFVQVIRTLRDLLTKKEVSKTAKHMLMPIAIVHDCIADHPAKIFFALIGCLCLDPSMPYFNPFMLSIVIKMSATLQNIIRAVSLSAQGLMMSTMFGFICVLAFSMFGFYFFYNYFQDSSQHVNECSSMLQCLVVHLRFGVLNGGGIGDHLDNDLSRYPIFASTRSFSERVVYDFLFFAVINVLLLNIIFGMIIDTFSRLRDETQVQVDQMKNICFVCNLPKESFEGQGSQTNLTFRHHIKKEHNMWNYMFYLIYLKNKDPALYNGMECYVMRLWEEEDISWVPKGAALAVQLDDSVMTEMPLAPLSPAQGHRKSKASSGEGDEHADHHRHEEGDELETALNKAGDKLVKSVTSSLLIMRREQAEGLASLATKIKQLEQQGKATDA